MKQFISFTIKKNKNSILIKIIKRQSKDKDWKLIIIIAFQKPKLL